MTKSDGFKWAGLGISVFIGYMWWRSWKTDDAINMYMKRAQWLRESADKLKRYQSEGKEVPESIMRQHQSYIVEFEKARIAAGM